MRPLLRSSFLLVFFTLWVSVAQLGAQDEVVKPEPKMSHDDPQWTTVQSHLPDPQTASAAKLELAADVLRARRFPADALEYYNYALQRGGGDQTLLLNKMGVTELELQNMMQARAYFQRAVKLKKKNADGWNNLGAVEYLEHRYRNAILDYDRAIKINKKESSFHSNLGTAYFDLKQFDSARKEFEVALKLDPEMFERRRMAAGVTAHLLSPEDHARFCYEMARLYAKNGDEADMLHSLQMASEGGFDVAAEMGRDASLSSYRKDPRVLMILQNARALRTGRAGTAVAAAGTVPPLPAPEQQHE
jgi:tetratricopeptide (TPR) repeat protein